MPFKRNNLNKCMTFIYIPVYKIRHKFLMLLSIHDYKMKMSLLID